MELVPASFPDLITRLYAETRVNDAVFELPRKKWYVPDPAEPDLTVKFHRQIAGNASGPAAGPQTQMAQNLLLSYAAGGRILELKTVQINDRLQIPRPCIDVTNIGYNVEWSQELLVEQSLREYVAGMMLIEIFRNDPLFAGTSLLGPHGKYIFDLSVGYDLAGIRGEKVQKFLDAMRDASAVVAELRGQIPPQFKLARELDYLTKLSETLTLSTFHGCPSDEIERICEFLIAERDLDVIVKMNPPMLGKDRLEHLLNVELGYKDLTVNPLAYTSGLMYDEGVQLVARLRKFAADRGKSFGCKFSNTLEVLNHRDFFTKDNKVQYLSGQPLHVITMTLTDVMRKDIGSDVPISFSAGIDRQNFASAVACGFVPATVCTDLLRPGGYGRLSPYLKTLATEMNKVGAKNIDEFILKAYGQGTDGEVNAAAVNEAAEKNTTIAAEKARNDPRYRYEQNKNRRRGSIRSSLRSIASPATSAFRFVRTRRISPIRRRSCRSISMTCLLRRMGPSAKRRSRGILRSTRTCRSLTSPTFATSAVTATRSARSTAGLTSRSQAFIPAARPGRRRSRAMGLSSKI
jgi:putative selenate reductase